MNPHRRRDIAIESIIAERESQGWDDSKNTQGCWVGYIVNYVSRFMMPLTYDTSKYNFRVCMVKVAALAVAAIEWWDEHHAPKGCITIKCPRCGHVGAEESFHVTPIDGDFLLCTCPAGKGCGKFKYQRAPSSEHAYRTTSSYDLSRRPTPRRSCI